MSLPKYGSVLAPPAPEPTEERAASSRLRVVVPVLLAAAGVAGVAAATRAAPAQPAGLVHVAAPVLASHHKHSAATAPHTLKMSLESLEYAQLNASYPFLQGALWAEPQRGYELKVSSPEKLESCVWNSYLLAGGGVYDDITGVLAASEWAPHGHQDVDTNDLTVKVTVTFPSPGTFMANLTCGFKDGASTSVAEQVKVTYVRRELRELSQSDLNQFLDAFITMSKTPTDKGVTEYGKHFRSLTDFQVMHLRAAGGILNDHMHDGLGVATQHLAMTMEFELAMQSVNPRLSVPYWDYTYDSEEVKRKNDNKVTTSTIFTESWLFSDKVFGRTSGATHTVLAGRMSQILLDVDYNYTTRSAFGLLRAPWNLNPSRNVTRYHKFCGEEPYMEDLYSGDAYADKSFMWPTCEMHYNTIYKAEYNSFFDWAWKISYAPHGPVHAWIGGVDGSCNHWDTLEKDGLLTKKQVQYAKHWAFAILKNAYRFKAITMPSYCSSDSADECTWSCAELNNTIHAVWYEAALELVPNVTAGHAHFWEIVDKLLCSGHYWPGDQLEASSPIEASFWPIHPTLDRLLQYKDMAQPFTNKTWDGVGEYCVYSDTGCKGHHAYDLTFFKSVQQDRKTGKFVVSHKTNLEVREAVMPRTGDYSVAYIYNHFEWSHCESAGYHF